MKTKHKKSGDWGKCWCKIGCQIIMGLTKNLPDSDKVNETANLATQHTGYMQENNLRRLYVQPLI